MSPFTQARDAGAAIQAWIGGRPQWRRAADILATYSAPTYLVGGSVRDALCGQSGEDLDVAVDGATRPLGRFLADTLGGAYFVMDADHDVSRVMLDNGDGRLHIDLASLRRSTILDDLRARDLTVNAMGYALRGDSNALLDPTGGLQDLEQRTIRHAYPAAFSDDPLRLLRAVRLCGSLGYTLHDSTARLIEQERARLSSVSRERVRDEVLLMLEQGTTVGLHLALDLQLLGLALAPASGNELRPGLRWLDTLTAHSSMTGPAARHFEKARSVSSDTGRSRYQLIALAALLSGVGQADSVLQDLRLSNHESASAKDILCSLESHLWELDRTPDDLESHRYYREYGQSGADGAALMLASSDSPAGATIVASRLLQVWCQERERVARPTPVVGGREMVTELGVEPGPRVSELLRQLLEVQVLGEVTDHESGVAWIRAAQSQTENEGKQVQSPW